MWKLWDSWTLLTNYNIRFLFTVSASGYIVSAALVLIIGALVGVLATISRHLHHRRLLVHEPVPPGSASSSSASILHYHHRHHHHRHRLRREEPPPPPLQRCLLLQDHCRHPDTPVSIIWSRILFARKIMKLPKTTKNRKACGLIPILPYDIFYCHIYRYMMCLKYNTQSKDMCTSVYFYTHIYLLVSKK